MRHAIVLIILTWAIIAAALYACLAQQPPSFTEQAMGQKIMQEINNGLACSAKLIEVQKQLEDMQAKFKDLESKDKKKEGS
jgi:hypothetical protein